MNRLKRFIGSNLIFLFCTYILTCNGDLEFCSKSSSDGIYWINQTNCAFGILFPEPILVDCLASTNTGAMKSSVCNDTDVDTSTFPIQLQYVSQNEAVAIEEADTCYKPEKCGAQELLEDVLWTDKILTPALMHKNEPWPDSSSGKVNDPILGNQTLRLFKHLMGFTNDGEGPALRIITILRKSFQILGRFCHNRYVPLEFGEDVLEAFLFILGEADTTRIMDIGLDEFRKIDEALNGCMDQPDPFVFTGSTCKTYGFIETINTTKGFVKFAKNEFSWTAEKYDIPVDVTWATADFVHGLCYGTFKHHVNSHHLYQQAIERIFTPEIIARWDKPVVLARQDVWDHFFSANVRNTIENLESCIQAAYYDAPFLHRLERLLKHYDGPRSPTPPPPLDETVMPHSNSTIEPEVDEPLSSDEVEQNGPDEVETFPDPAAGSTSPGTGTPDPNALTTTTSPDSASSSASSGADSPDAAAVTSAITEAAIIETTEAEVSETTEAAVIEITEAAASETTEAAVSETTEEATTETAISETVETETPEEAPSGPPASVIGASAEPERRRRKREAAALTLPPLENLRFYCFKTEEERDQTLEKYKASICSA